MNVTRAWPPRVRNWFFSAVYPHANQIPVCLYDRLALHDKGVCQRVFHHYKGCLPGGSRLLLAPTIGIWK